MNWNQVLIAGMAWGLAAFVGSIASTLMRDKTKRQYLMIVVTVALGTVLNEVGKEWVLPRLEADKFQAEIRKELESPDSILADLFKDRPDLVAIYESELLEAYRSGGRPAALAAAQEFGRKYLAANLIETVANASDSEVIHFLKVFSVVLGEMNQDDPVACYHFLFGGGEPARLARNYRPGRKEEIANLIAAIQKEKRSAPKVGMAQKEMEDLTSVIVAKLQKEWQLSIPEIQLLPAAARATSDTDRSTICRVSYAFYSEMAKLPEADGPNLFRAVMGPVSQK